MLKITTIVYVYQNMSVFEAADSADIVERLANEVLCLTALHIFPSSSFTVLKPELYTQGMEDTQNYIAI